MTKEPLPTRGKVELWTIRSKMTATWMNGSTSILSEPQTAGGHRWNTELERNGRNKMQQHPLPKGHVMLSHSCLLLPVAILAWWYWTKRKARSMVSRLMLRSHVESTDSFDGHYSSWEEVKENHTHDSSERLVRWIKGNDIQNSTRKRASVQHATKRTLRVATSQHDMTSPMIDDHAYVETPSGIRWQCLEDMNGFDLCTLSDPSNDDGKEPLTNGVFL